MPSTLTHYVCFVFSQLACAHVQTWQLTEYTCLGIRLCRVPKYLCVLRILSWFVIRYWPSTWILSRDDLYFCVLRPKGIYKYSVSLHTHTVYTCYLVGIFLSYFCFCGELCFLFSIVELDMFIISCFIIMIYHYFFTMILAPTSSLTRKIHVGRSWGWIFPDLGK